MQCRWRYASSLSEIVKSRRVFSMILTRSGSGTVNVDGQHGSQPQPVPSVGPKGRQSWSKGYATPIMPPSHET